MGMKMKIWIDRARGSGIKEKTNIREACRNQCCAGSLAAAKEEVAAAAVYCG